MMMGQCFSTQKAISEYVDGALPADRAWALKMHLSICGECAHVEAEMRKIVALLGESHVDELPATFERGLALKLAAIRQTGAARTSLFDRLSDLGRGFEIRWSVQKRWTVAVVGVGAIACVAALPFLSLDNAPPTSSASPSVQSAAGSNLDFVAACSSDNARYQSTQALADPMAQTLAARTDAIGAQPEATADLGSD